MTHVFKDLSGSGVMKEWRESRSRAVRPKAFAVTKADASVIRLRRQMCGADEFKKHR